MNYKHYKHLPPFKGMVLQNFPFIEEDFDAITNYQLLCKIVEYLKNVIANELTMEENVTNLYNSFVELKNYVDNYFANLDVQEEINNKLDEMASDGTLYSIINRFIQPEIDNINNVIDEQNDRLNVMNSRINEITSLPEGSTTGDAELQDIRVGFDGTIYENAGDSVREQIDFLDKQINKNSKFKRLQILSQNNSTFYKNIILPNHKYIIYYKTASFATSCYLCETPTYISNYPTNIRLWNLVNNPQNIVIEPKNIYRSLYLWNDETHSEDTPFEIILYDITENISFENTCYEIPLTFYNGGYNDGGGSNDSVENKVLIPAIPIDGLYLITFPDEIYCRCVLPLNNYTTGTKVISYYHPMSVNHINNDHLSNTMRVCFGYKDNTPLRTSDTIINNIHVYVIKNNNPIYDIIVGADNTPNHLKSTADIVVNSSNSTEILASITGCETDIKALILDGTYDITKFYTMEDGSHCSLPLIKNGRLQYEDVLVRRNISIEGRSMTTPQQINNVIFKVSETCHNSILNNEYFIMGTPYRNNTQIQRFHTSVQFKNFNILGWLYDKPVTYLDLSSCLSVELESVNIRSWNEHINTYTAFNDTPNLECTGIRVGRGNQYGIQNFVKNLNVWYCGKGFVCNGEHFILEDIKTHHDYIGFYFGDKYTVGRMQHPNVMIGCSIESCYRFMVLTKGGITTEQDFSEASDETGIFHSTLVMIGTSTENRWDIPVNEREGGVTSQHTLPILEVIKNCYRGRIEIDESLPIFENGSGNGFIVYRYNGGNLIISKGSNVIE